MWQSKTMICQSTEMKLTDMVWSRVLGNVCNFPIIIIAVYNQYVIEMGEPIFHSWQFFWDLVPIRQRRNMRAKKPQWVLTKIQLELSQQSEHLSGKSKKRTFSRGYESHKLVSQLILLQQQNQS